MTAAGRHDDNSVFRILAVGVDGFLAQAQMIDAAEETLDLQYFIFRGDETGRLLVGKLLAAANRGVRVRLLIDDGATDTDDDQIIALDDHPAIEVRIFNPFAYRGHRQSLRMTEFLLGFVGSSGCDFYRKAPDTTRSKPRPTSVSNMNARWRTVSSRRRIGSSSALRRRAA